MFKKNKKSSVHSHMSHPVGWIVGASFVLVIICAALWLYFWQSMYM